MKRNLSHDKMALAYVATCVVAAFVAFSYAAHPANIIAASLLVCVGGYALFSFIRSGYYVYTVRLFAKKAPDQNFMTEYREGKAHFQGNPQHANIRDCPYSATSDKGVNWGHGFFHGCGQMDGLNIPDFEDETSNKGARQG